MTSSRLVRRRRRPRCVPGTRAVNGHVRHEPSCRLVFVLAEGLRHIGERRAREAGRRGTMRVLRPARQTDPMKQPPRTRTRTRPRRAPIAS